MGGTGPDTLIATHDDVLIGGTGASNLFAINSGPGISVQAGTQNNTLSFAPTSAGVRVNLFGGTAQDSANNTISLSGTFPALTGGSGDDTLMSGGASNVYIQAGSGNAQLIASGGSSITLFGGTGNDTLSSSGGSDITLMGGSGNDSLSSTGGTNVLLQ